MRLRVDRSPPRWSRVHSLVSRLLFGVPSPFLLVVPLGTTRPARVPSLFAASPQVSTRTEARPLPLRSAHRFSQPLDGFLHLPALRACCIPQPRPGCSVQGFLPIRSRPDSSPVRASLPLPSRCSPTRTPAATVRLLGFEALLRGVMRSSRLVFSLPRGRSPLRFPSSSRLLLTRRVSRFPGSSAPDVTFEIFLRTRSAALVSSARLQRLSVGLAWASTSR